MSYQEHQTSAERLIARVAIITLSDTRNESSDTSGASIRRLLAEAGHDCRLYRIIPDDAAGLEALLGEWTARQDIDAILTNGGTGISRRDQAVSVIERSIDTPLPGFGELFRMLSHAQIGSGAMLSRALGGVARGKLLFAMPGSSRAVELAMTQLILPELRHLLWELRK